MGDIRVGTSGWHYPTGKGTWDGVFYPPKRGRRKTFDELAYYAEHFNTVEINATFYGQPRAEVSRAWVERTPAGFEFSVKLYQKFTHPRMFQKRVDQALPHEAGRAGEAGGAGRESGLTVAFSCPTCPSCPSCPIPPSSPSPAPAPSRRDGASPARCARPAS